jgi:hypothetical protein
MRIVTILLLALVITACAPRPSLKELEEQAMVSGDWTAVEYREEMAENRLEKSGPDCPRDLVKVCIEAGPAADCHCARPSGGR